MGSMLARRLAGIVDNDIQISGFYEFPEAEWREAIAFYLSGILSGNDVCERPKIIFGELTLRLDPGRSEYFAYGRGTETPPAFTDSAILTVGRSQSEVEQGLARFVRDNQIKALTIVLENSAQVQLWKKSKRSQYGISTDGVPLQWGLLGPAALTP